MASNSDFASDSAPDGIGSGDEDAREVCRDFMRNACVKGEKCKYKHPTQDLVTLLDTKSVCHDFQNRGCTRQSCKYVHVTIEEEKYIRETGRAPSTMEPNRRHTLSGDVPMCGDYMKGRCNRGERCKFRHGDGPRSQDAPPPTSRYGPYSRGGTRERERDREPRGSSRGGYQDSALLEEELMVLKEQMGRLRRQVVELTMTNEDLVVENDSLKSMVSSSGSSRDGGRYGAKPTAYRSFNTEPSPYTSAEPEPSAYAPFFAQMAERVHR